MRRKNGAMEPRGRFRRLAFLVRVRGLAVPRQEPVDAPASRAGDEQNDGPAEHLDVLSEMHALASDLRTGEFPIAVAHQGGGGGEEENRDGNITRGEPEQDYSRSAGLANATPMGYFRAILIQTKFVDD